jgi:hypothetical protein
LFFSSRKSSVNPLFEVFNSWTKWNVEEREEGSEFLILENGKRVGSGRLIIYKGVRVWECVVGLQFDQEGMRSLKRFGRSKRISTAKMGG